MITNLFTSSKSQSAGNHYSTPAGKNPRLAHFFKAHSATSLPDPSCSSSTIGNGSPSGFAARRSGPSSEENDQAVSLFVAMMFVALGTHVSYLALSLAFHGYWSAIAAALVASFFWERAWKHVRRSISSK